MSAGGGGGGSTRYEWNDAMAPYWGGLLQQARDASYQPYQAYTGDRTANQNGDNTAAIGGIENFVKNPGDYLYGQGNLQYQDTLGGQYLTGSGANPFSVGNQYADPNSQYFKDALQAGNDSITQNYQNATAPQLDSQAVLNGTFGGGDHQRMIDRNQQDLAKQLGQYDAGMRNDQYNRSAQLDESYLNRGSTNYEDERNRMMQAGSASQADQGLTLDRMNALMGAGEYQRNLNQADLNNNYQNWFDQTNYGKNQMAWLSSMLSAAQGGMPANQMTMPGGSSGLGNALGSALGAYGLFRS